MPMTPAQRKAAERARYRNQGRVRREVYIPIAELKEFDRYVAGLVERARRQRGRDE